MEQVADRNIFGMGNQVYEIKGVHGTNANVNLCDSGGGHLLAIFADCRMMWNHFIRG